MHIKTRCCTVVRALVRILSTPTRLLVEFVENLVVLEVVCTSDSLNKDTKTTNCCLMSTFHPMHLPGHANHFAIYVKLICQSKKPMINLMHKTVIKFFNLETITSNSTEIRPDVYFITFRRMTLTVAQFRTFYFV